jgi:hypothetical protein
MRTFFRGFASIAIIGLFILTASVSLFATETRVSSMGGVGFYMKDNSNIFFYPGAINQYAGQVIGELRVKNANQTYTVGVNYPINDQSVFGMYLNRPIGISIPAGIVNEVTLDQTTDFFYGKKMSQFDLGIRLSAALDSYKDDTTDKESAHYFALGLGISNEKTDLGLTIEMPGVSRKFIPEEDTLEIENKWSGMAFGFNGRMFYGEKTKIVPVVNFRFGSAKADMDATSGSPDVDYSLMNLGLGVGLNHQIDENNLLVLGLEVFGLSSEKADIDSGNTNTTTITTMPGLYMGLESQINSWLTGRVGAAQVFQTTKTKVEPPSPGVSTESSDHTSDYKVYFGLGIHFGDFLLDAAVNEGLFFDGPNFVSGQNNAMANKLSLTYKF